MVTAISKNYEGEQIWNASAQVTFIYVTGTRNTLSKTKKSSRACWIRLVQLHYTLYKTVFFVETQAFFRNPPIPKFRPMPSTLFSRLSEHVLAITHLEINILYKWKLKSKLHSAGLNFLKNSNWQEKFHFTTNPL